MKPRSKRIKFDASWLVLLPANKRGDYQFMYDVALAVQRRRIKRSDLRSIQSVIRQINCA